MILLDATTKSLELVTSAATNVDYLVTYADNTTSAFTPGATDGQITTATTTTILAAPASSTQRTIKLITVLNTSTTTSNSVKLQYDVSGTNRIISPNFSLGPGESLRYTQEEGFRVYLASGGVKNVKRPPVVGQTVNISKTITAPEAASNMYSAWKDAGAPGVWAPGTSGLAGRATDGTAAGDAGCVPLIQPSTGTMYIRSATTWGAQAGVFNLWDVLWVNNAIVVTTTTAQTINSVTLPARDLNLSTNGEGTRIALVFTAASTNAGTISTSTISYTNQAGTSGKTATLTGALPSLIPATPAIGTVVTFALAAGDTGVRSIESITLATSLVTGSVSLIIYRPIIELGLVAVGAAYTTTNLMAPIPPKACLLPFFTASATTSGNLSCTFTVTEEV